MTEETYKGLSETTTEAVHIVYELGKLIIDIMEVVDHVLVGRRRRCESCNEERGNRSELDGELHTRGCKWMGPKFSSS